MINEITNNINIEGRIKAETYDTSSLRALVLEREIEEHIKKPWYPRHRDHYLEMINELRTLFKVHEWAINNIVVTAGRAVIAQRLGNDTTYTGVINFGALGDDNTAATNADTTLGNEVFRKAPASTSDTDNISFIDFFYSKADTNGTYEEFGTFIDGTASADTGQLFTHLITGGWTKTASESMTIAAQYTIT